MTPWIDTEKIRVGPISPEERGPSTPSWCASSPNTLFVAGVKPRTGRPFVCGAVTKAEARVQSRTRCAAESLQRRVHAAACARKEADNVADKVEVRFLDAYAAGKAATERVAAT